VQNSVCSDTDAVLPESLAKMTITNGDYWSIESVVHTHLEGARFFVRVKYRTSDTMPGYASASEVVF
jgi:hypothetical protein